MAVRAQKPKVLKTVVVSNAVDMVQLQSQRHPIMGAIVPAQLANIGERLVFENPETQMPEITVKAVNQGVRGPDFEVANISISLWVKMIGRDPQFFDSSFDLAVLVTGHRKPHHPDSG